MGQQALLHSDKMAATRASELVIALRNTGWRPGRRLCCASLCLGRSASMNAALLVGRSTEHSVLCCAGHIYGPAGKSKKGRGRLDGRGKLGPVEQV